MIPFADPNLAEATWILIVKSIVIFAVVMGIVPLLTVVERKVLGRFQHRYGPNRVGPVGLLQPLADAVKLISKEHYRPRNAVSVLWILGPVLVVFSGLTALAIIPFGNVQDGFGLYGIDVPIGILYFFAFGSIAFYGLLLGGWASGSEYIEMFVISAVAVTFFLGGWHGPGPGFLDPIWVILKIFVFLFLFMWIRATLPRVRYDQLMSLGWKVLLPLATLNVLVTAILVTVT